MPTIKHILQFLLAAMIVVMIGGFAGWYFFIKSETDNVRNNDAARGFGEEAPLGSAFNNSGAGSGGGAVTSGGTTGGSTGNAGIFNRIANAVTFGWWGGSGSNAGISSMLSFGDDPADSADPAAENEGPLVPVAPARLWRVSASPVAGFGFVNGSTALRFAERANGNIVSADASTGAVTRITNTLIPKVYEALFSRDGAVVLRSISETGLISTFAAIATTTDVAATSTFSKLDGVNLPSNIESVAVHPSDRRLLYVVKGTAGVTATEASWRDSDRKVVFTSALAEWDVEWLSDKIAVTQKPADGVAGFAFFAKNGALTPAIRNVPGLQYLPRAESDAILYSSSDATGVHLFAQVSPDASVIELPVRTIAEKCAWAPGPGRVAYCAAPQEVPQRGFLFSWFNGSMHTADTLWRIDASAGTAEQMRTPLNDETIDVLEPAINDAGTHLAFLNARDMTIWVLRLAE